MKQALVVVFLFAAVLMPLAAAGRAEKAAPQAQAPYTIEVAGSTSVAPLMEKLAARYRVLQPHITININSTGSSDGINAANAGTSELGMSSRALRTAEKGFGLDELLIAVDGIAVIVNPANPVTNLTMAQIQGIYTGTITDWSQVGGRAGRIAVVSREPGSGTRGAFEEIIDFRDRLVRGASEFSGTGGVKAEVSKNADAIGYISIGSVDSSVRAINVEGVAPTAANVVAGSFRIARPFLVLYRGPRLNAETRRFLDWVMSPEGQAIAKTDWIAVR